LPFDLAGIPEPLLAVLGARLESLEAQTGAAIRGEAAADLARSLPMVWA
jgi:hypothetical protein